MYRACEIRLCAERKPGSNRENGQARPPKKEMSHEAALKKNGISRDQSSKWQISTQPDRRLFVKAFFQSVKQVDSDLQR
jgi:hypothetical protein